MEGKVIKRRKRTPTAKQIKALHLMSIPGYSKRRALIEAGYSKAYASSPKRTLNRESFKSIAASMGKDLDNLGLNSKYWALKIKGWSESKSEKIQMGAYDRWYRVISSEEQKEKDKSVKRRITYEEFVGVEEKNGNL